LQAVRVTEAAALAGSGLSGRGDERALEEAAAFAMYQTLDSLPIAGTIVIGDEEEGSPLRVGAKVGRASHAEGAEPGQEGTAFPADPKIDIALDALEGATITAKGGPNALAVVAMAEHGGLLPVPEVYMEKIAVGPGLPPGIIDLDASPEDNLRRVAEARRVDVTDLVVCLLDRPRHDDLINRVREAGARIFLINDGDVSGVIATALPDAGVDLYLGSGGAPEGILAAAALHCMGGQMQGRLILRNEEDKAKARRMGVKDFSRKLDLSDMAHGSVMFAATGVTYGTLLKGVRRFHGGAVTHSMVMRSQSGTFRFIEAHHDFTRKPDPSNRKPDPSRK